jgi:hypothetical protein
MDEKIYPDVASFLIRFVKDQTDTKNYRGIIRYVQADEEILFTSWDEVEDFIQRVIPLEKSKTQKGVENEIEG